MNIGTQQIMQEINVFLEEEKSTLEGKEIPNVTTKNHIFLFNLKIVHVLKQIGNVMSDLRGIFTQIVLK